MIKFRTRQRLREKTIEIADHNRGFSNPSILLLSKHTDLEENFWKTFNNSLWGKISPECFVICIVNLMLTKKIKVTYFIDKVSTFFDLYRYESEGYNILLLEGNYPEDDILTKDIISSIKNIEYQEKGNLRPIIREVINKYIDTKELPRPQKDFFYKYLNAFAKKNKWIKLKSNNTFLGLITNYNIEIEPDKKLEILKSYSDFNIIKNRLRKQNLPFRKFILDLEEEIKSDFSSRYPRS